MPEALTPISLALAVRPTRAAVLVPQIEGVAWQRLMTAALSTQSLIWGGSGNLVFPIADDLEENELFWRALDVFDPDAFLVYAPANGEMDGLDPEWYAAELGRLDQQGVLADDFVELWRDDYAVEPWFPTHLSDAIVRRFAPLHRDGEPVWDVINGRSERAPFLYTNAFMLDQLLELGHDPRREALPRPLINPSTTVGDVEDLILATEVGRLSHGARTLWDARDLPGGPRAIDTAAEWAGFMWGERPRDGYPLVVSEHGLEWYRTRPYGREPFFLVAGGGVWDFVLFYALRRLTSRALWLPPEILNQPSYVQWIASHVLRSFAHAGVSDLHVVSFSDEEGRSDAITALQGAMALGDRDRMEFVEADWSDSLPEAPNRLFERGGYGRNQPTLLHGGMSPEIETPIPQISAEDPSAIHWMTDVRVDGWCAIRNHRLGTKILDIPGYDTGFVRTGADASAYFCPHFMYFGGMTLETLTVRPRLRPLDLATQVEAVLREQGWSSRRSDKGAYAAESAALVGGFSQLASLLAHEPTWHVISAFREEHSPGRTLANDRRRYLCFEDICAVLADRNLAVLTLRRLEGVSALTRGFILKCRRCRAASWYPLSEIGESFRCRRCRLDQPLSEPAWLDPVEPVWHYQLAEVIQQLLDNNGDLPIYTAVDYFEATPHEPVAFTFEVEFFDPEGNKSEHDLVLSQGSRLWIGEVTKADRFEASAAAQRARFDRLAAVADATDAYGIVLASSRESYWSRVEPHARAAFGERSLRLISGVRSAGQPPSIEGDAAQV